MDHIVTARYANEATNGAARGSVAWTGYWPSDIMHNRGIAYAQKRAKSESGRELTLVWEEEKDETNVRR